MPATKKVAVVGAGNIGADLVMKIVRSAGSLELSAVADIDPHAAGLQKGMEIGVPTTCRGIGGLLELEGFDDIDIVFDATSAAVHRRNVSRLHMPGKRVIDLTAGAAGPLVVPAVNMEDHLNAPVVNLVTCPGQAAIPIIAALASVADVAYAEVVASIASNAAGPALRANIDEFTEVTGLAIEQVGGAKRGKAMTILNPADPPLTMRDTVFALVHANDELTQSEIEEAVEMTVEDIASSVPGYRLKQQVQMNPIAPGSPVGTLLRGNVTCPTHQVSIFLEVEGAGDHLPAYAGNLDVMTTAAVLFAERIATADQESAA
ncbi:acetaldehyde dehydrogenase (acetylating) [Gordonia jinhuaensis]|uniref:acetaldehyde dehydrogenase (acetylating) n=1 Tax=Gordonia jinhuaensis TaxID=1517702 RepID=UPI00166915B9|nr:acetaldehyde dehydrogenase (acetylating) [Gordonia jinhuaensis]